MQNIDVNVKNKYCLMLCELHHPEIHGKTDTSDPNIENHYLVYDRFIPNTGMSLGHLEEYGDLDTDDEYDSDNDMEERGFSNLNNEMKFLNEIYLNRGKVYSHNFGAHPTIRNYQNIISKKNYIKPEIGEYIILPTQEAIAILKTFWLRIFQRKWKKLFKERKLGKHVKKS